MRKRVNLGITDLLELSQAIFGKGKSIRFQAKGGSMRPFIQEGDFIIVSPIENFSIKIGDVVFYSTAEDEAIVHRVMKKYNNNGEMTLLIKGDACFGPSERVDIQDVLGRVIAIERKGWKKRLDTKVYRIIGLFFAGISPFSRWTYLIGNRVKRIGRILLGFRQIPIPQ